MTDLTNTQKANRRNKRLANKLPLFAQAGIIDQVARIWDAKQVMDDAFDRAIYRDVIRQEYLRENKVQLSRYQILCDIFQVCPIPTKRTMEYVLDNHCLAIAEASQLRPWQIHDMVATGNWDEQVVAAQKLYEIVCGGEE